MTFLFRVLTFFALLIALTPLLFSKEINHKVEDPPTDKKFFNRFVNGLVRDTFLTEKEEASNSNLFEDSSKDREIKLNISIEAHGAKLRVLDKIYGTVQEIKIFDYAEVNYQSLEINLNKCFYDKGNLRNDSMALIKISDNQGTSAPYTGWISVTYSHLTNYNNYRYSVWLLSCIISGHE